MLLLRYKAVKYGIYYGVMGGPLASGGPFGGEIR